MSMGKRRRVDGEEYDLYSTFRHLIGWGQGQRAGVKRMTHKRERREGRSAARREGNDNG